MSNMNFLLSIDIDNDGNLRELFSHYLKNFQQVSVEGARKKFSSFIIDNAMTSVTRDNLSSSSSECVVKGVEKLLQFNDDDACEILFMSCRPARFVLAIFHLLFFATCSLLGDIVARNSWMKLLLLTLYLNG